MANSDVATSVQDQLCQVLTELRSQREEVQALKEEVQGSSLNVASEVKKLKVDKDLVWKYQGNKIQFDFNNDAVDAVKQALWAIEHGKLDYCKEQLNELLEKYRKRNKLIRIADSSTGGWETVRQYQSNPIASDSDDESKIYKAESRALKRKRMGSRGKSSTVSRYSDVSSCSSYSRPSEVPVQSGSSAFRSGGRGRFFRGPYASSGFTRSNSVAGAGGVASAGSCFACGEFSHYRRDCPYINRSSASTGEQPVVRK